MNSKEIITKRQTTDLVNTVCQLYSETNEKFKTIIKKIPISSEK